MYDQWSVHTSKQDTGTFPSRRFFCFFYLYSEFVWSFLSNILCHGLHFLLNSESFRNKKSNKETSKIEIDIICLPKKGRGGLLPFLMMFTKIMDIYDCSLPWCLFCSSVRDLLIWKMCSFTKLTIVICSSQIKTSLNSSNKKNFCKSHERKSLCVIKWNTASSIDI